MESTEPPTAEETALEALRDWLNVEQKPNRLVLHSFTLHIHGSAGEAFRAKAAKLLCEAGFEFGEFCEKEFLDKDKKKYTMTFLTGRKLHCARVNRKTA